MKMKNIAQKEKEERTAPMSSSSDDRLPEGIHELDIVTDMDCAALQAWCKTDEFVPANAQALLVEGSTDFMSGREFRDVITASLDEREGDTCAFEKQWFQHGDGVASCEVFAGGLDMKFRIKGSTRDIDGDWDADTASCSGGPYDEDARPGNRCNFHGHAEEEGTSDYSPRYPWPVCGRVPCVCGRC